jgi:cyanate permease
LGRPPVITACLAAIIATHLAFLFAPAGWRTPALALTGMLISGASVLTVLLAQELRPRARATAAGVVQGLGYTVAAVGTWLVGVLADAWGPTSAMSTLALVAALGALAAWALRRSQPLNTA